MVELTFELSTSWNKGKEADLKNVGAAELRYDCFLGDVRFRVDDADFSALWGWVPVLDFALGIFGIIRELESDQSAKFDFTESDSVIQFERGGDNVEISCTYNSHTTRVEYVDLLRESQHVALQVFDELKRDHPDLDENTAFQHFHEEISSEMRY